jgi:hypothetical protein
MHHFWDGEASIVAIVGNKTCNCCKQEPNTLTYINNRNHGGDKTAATTWGLNLENPMNHQDGKPCSLAQDAPVGTN